VPTGTRRPARGRANLPAMARNEMLYRGQLLLDPDGDPVAGELWVQGETAVVFERTTGKILGTVHHVTLDLDDQQRLRVNGYEATWQALAPEQQLGAWVGVKVQWPDGAWETATVSWTNYRVAVSKQGQETRILPGARTMVQGTQRWIQYGDTRLSIDAGRKAGCIPCGGGKR